MSSAIIRKILSVFFLLTICINNLNAQESFVARKAVKQTATTTAAKTVKKTVKESTGEAVEKAIKKTGREIGSETAENAAKKSGSEIIHNTLETKTPIKESVNDEANKARNAAAKNKMKEQSKESVEKGVKSIVQGDRIEKYKKVLRNGYPNKEPVVKEFTGKEALDALDEDLKAYVEKVRATSPAFFTYDKLVVKEEAGGAKIILFKDSASSIRVEGDLIQGYGGALEKVLDSGTHLQYGQTNQFLRNSVLLPNKVYDAEDGMIKYFTNGRGEVVKVTSNSSDLYNSMAEKKIFRSAKVDAGMKDDLNKVFSTTGSDHDYGHLVGRELGGLDEGINALPMKHELQGSGSEWSKLEQLEVNACEGGHKVTSEMTITRHTGSKNFDITVTKTVDGVKHQSTFKGMLN